MNETERRFRFQIWHNRKSPEGKFALAFGMRIGYWPCLKAPFISIACGPVALDLWHGLPSYRDQHIS